LKGYLSLMKGPAPIISNHGTLADEAKAIAAFVRAGEARRTCSSRKLNRWVTKYHDEPPVALLSVPSLARPVTTRPSLASVSDHAPREGPRFDRVIVAGANADLLPLASALARASDGPAREDAEHTNSARCSTSPSPAPRREVLITSHGKPSEGLLPEGKGDSGSQAHRRTGQYFGAAAQDT
jgi:hypothetical protein